MKATKLVLFFIFCISTSIVYPQWTPVTSNSTQYLRDVKFIDSLTGVAVGVNGTILRTTDKGQSWNSVTSGTEANLYSVDFVDDQGWAVGVNGTIKYSSNQGENWSNQNSNTTIQLISVDFASEQIGYAVGGNFASIEEGVIVKTSNGGDSWFVQYNVDQVLTSVFFITERIGWVVGTSGLILKTTDAGNSWMPMTSGTSHWLYSVYFLDEYYGFAVGGDVNTEKILKTTDGGISWFSKLETGTYQWLGDVFFCDPNNGWVVGAGGVILKTSNGGESWIKENTGVNSYFGGVDFVDGKWGWVVGEGGTILKYSYSFQPFNSQNWTLCTSNSTSYLRDICFFDSLSGIAIGSNGSILKSIDGGLNWSLFQTSSVFSFNSIDFVENKGWLVGGNGTIKHSLDFGDNWIDQTSGTNLQLISVDFVNLNIGYAVGGSFNFFEEEGIIIKTTNGGTSWSTISLPTVVCTGVQFISEDVGWVVGTHGTIYKTTDAGLNWLNLNSGTNQWLYGLHFINVMTGWAVGGNVNSEIILKTTDGGINWINQRETSAYQWLASVHFLNQNRGWVVGERGVVLRTTNGGDTWARESTPMNSYLTGISFFNDNLAWAVGSFGSIIKYCGDPDTSYIDVGYPNGGERLRMGQNILIEWTGFGFDYVKIEYTTNGGSSWNLINENAPNSWNFNWLVPSEVSTDCLVRISSVNTSGVADISDFPFEIVNYVPVELNEFSCVSLGNSVLLEWQTETETNNRGFFIERKTQSNSWIQRGFIQGNGSTTEPHKYQFSDVDVANGNYSYRIIQYDYDGSNKIIAESDVEVLLPLEFSLDQNYPNPFNPKTIIGFSIPEQKHICLKVFDVLGREILTLLDEKKPAGKYQIIMDAKNLQSGVYFYRLETGGIHITKKCVFLK